MPVTAAINGFHEMQEWERTDGTFSALDIGGYNYQWRQYRPDHERLPERGMFGTESFPGEAFENWTSVHHLCHAAFVGRHRHQRGPQYPGAF